MNGLPEIKQRLLEAAGACRENLEFFRGNFRLHKGEWGWDGQSVGFSLSLE